MNHSDAQTTAHSPGEGEGLPPGWVETTLGEVVEYGKTVKAEPADIPPDAWILELEDIEKDTSQILSRCSFQERQSKSTKNRFKVGDVLYGKLRPYLNKVIVADQDGYCTTEIIPMNGGDFLSSRYLFYWLKSPDFTAYVNAVSHGMNMPRLGTEAGQQAPFVLSPLPEQIRIADKLDALTARIEAGRERLERVPGLLRAFRQSVLSMAASEDGVEFCPLQDVIAEPLRNGRSVRDGKDGRVLRLTCLKAEGVDWREAKSGDWTGLDFQKFTVREGDFLISRGNGSLELVGRGALAGVPPEATAFPDTIIRLRPDVSIFLPAYLNLIWQTKSVRQQLQAAAKTTAGIFKVSQGDLEKIIISLPPLPEQAEIVRRVEALFALANRVEERYAGALAAYERLTPALLQKAFRGELVPQDPNDEPASVLLERIQAARAAEPKRGRGAGRPRKAAATAPAEDDVPAPATGKRRGRPRKAEIPSVNSEAEAVALLQARARARAEREGGEARTRQTGLWVEGEKS